MSVRPYRFKVKQRISEAGWRFYLDKQGRLQRRCRCSYCVVAYKRPAPGSRDEA